MNIQRLVMRTKNPKCELDLSALFEQVTGGPPSHRTVRSRMGRKLHFEILRSEHRAFTRRTNYPSDSAQLRFDLACSEASAKESDIPHKADPQFVPEVWLP